MRVLVAGGDGQVGRALRSLSLPDAVMRFESRRSMDICNPAAVQHAFRRFQPQYVINAAACTAVDQAELDSQSAWQVNAAGAAHLAQACNEHAACLLHLSTDYVFGGSGSRPWRETDLVRPLNEYGRSKLEAESLVRAGSRRAVILRTAWIFSAGGRGFVQHILRAACAGEPLSVVTDQIGNPTFAGDIARALMAIIRRLHANDAVTGVELFHFAGGPAVSRFEFAQYILEQACREGLLAQMPPIRPLRSDALALPARRPLNSVLDCRLISEVYGLAQPDWRLALGKLRSWLVPEPRRSL